MCLHSVRCSKKVSVSLIREIPDDFEINIPTNEELLGPVAKQIPGVASVTGATEQSHKLGLDLWMTLVKLLLEILNLINKLCSFNLHILIHRSIFM